MVFPIKVQIRATDSQQNRRLRILPNPSFLGSGGPLLGGLDVVGKGLPPGPVKFERDETDWCVGDEIMLCATNDTRKTTRSING